MSSFALPRVILLGQILAGVLSLALPTEASACACCDGGDRADVLGFTDTDAALLERISTAHQAGNPQDGIADLV